MRLVRIRSSNVLNEDCKKRMMNKEKRKGRDSDLLFLKETYAFAAPVFLIDSATSLIFAFTDSIFPSGIFALISSAILL